MTRRLSDETWFHINTTGSERNIYATNPSGCVRHWFILFTVFLRTKMGKGQQDEKNTRYDTKCTDSIFLCCFQGCISNRFNHLKLGGGKICRILYKLLALTPRCKKFKFQFFMLSQRQNRMSYKYKRIAKKSKHFLSFSFSKCDDCHLISPYGSNQFIE